jgi:penicillin-binding protein 1B
MAKRLIISSGDKKPPAKKKPAKKKPAKKKKAPAAKKKPAKKKAPSRRKKSAPSRRQIAVAWLRVEALVWAAGIAAGIVLAGMLIWNDARYEVREHLITPATSAPTSVWSAVIRVQPGDPYPKDELIADLLNARYEQVDDASRPGTFSARGDKVEIWTPERSLPGTDLPAKRVTLTLRDGRVKRIVPGDTARLQPTLLGVYGDLTARRDPVTLDEVSPWMIPALLAIEDARFHDHLGVDPIGIIRALVHNLTSDDTHGGSTLTQQLAKNLFLDARRTLRRKVHEVFYAAALESELSKDQLLELYLSEVYLGHHGGMPLYGVEQAARAWFARSSQRLDVSQAATIAGVISSPNRSSPLRSPQRAQERRDQVIHRMVYVHALTQVQANVALGEPLSLAPHPPTAAWRLPWAVSAALEEAPSLPGDVFRPGGGQHIYTTVQPHLQRAAQRAANDTLLSLVASHPAITNAEVAVASVEVGSGRLIALIGGRDPIKSPFHRARDAWRQGGSTIKPLTALAAMNADASLTGATRFHDAPITRRFDGRTWRPSNYDGVYLGDIPLRQVIEQSRNVPSVLLAERVGRTPLRAFLEAAGLSRATALPSAALGAFPTTTVELAGAYAAFPNQGRYNPPYLIEGLADTAGQRVYAHTPASRTLASPRASAQARRLLQGVITDGTGRGVSRAGLAGTLGGKTGTTDDGRDAWFVGFDADRSLAVWTGRDKGVLGLTGGQAAVPIWSAILKAWGGPRGQFRDGADLVAVEMCSTDGEPACPDCTERWTEWFPARRAPSAQCAATHARDGK